MDRLAGGSFWCDHNIKRSMDVRLDWTLRLVSAGRRTGIMAGIIVRCLCVVYPGQTVRPDN
jgi:hypothetical protein